MTAEEWAAKQTESKGVAYEVIVAIIKEAMADARQAALEDAAQWVLDEAYASADERLRIADKIRALLDAAP